MFSILKMVLKRILPQKLYMLLRDFHIKYEEYISFRAHQKSYSQRRESEKLTIIFLVLSPQSWNSLKPVYEAAEKYSNVTTYIVVLPYDFVNSRNKTSSAHEFFSSKYKNVIDAYKNSTWFDLKTLKPDVVFRQTPYDGSYPKQYSYRKMSQYTKLCYVPYGYVFSDKHRMIMFNSSAMSSLYAIFADSITSKDFCEKQKTNNPFFRDVKIYFLGFPRFSLISNDAIKRENHTFLWIPRWSVDSVNNDATGFFKYNRHLISFFSEHKDLRLIIRPHQLMFPNFIKEGLMTEDDARKFREQIQKLPNISLDDNFDYLDTFVTVDAMIADMSSLNIEFFLTGKPIIYCGAEDAYSIENKFARDTFYKVSNWEELMSRLVMLSNGDDDNFTIRQEAINNFIGDYKKYIGEAIIEKCLEII